jgi:hypothetical protein
MGVPPNGLLDLLLDQTACAVFYLSDSLVQSGRVVTDVRDSHEISAR